MLLKQLVSEENEFVIAAFDVFDSDKDTEELVDTLRALLRKIKSFRTKKHVDSLFPIVKDLSSIEHFPSKEEAEKQGSEDADRQSAVSSVCGTTTDESMRRTIHEVLRK